MYFPEIQAFCNSGQSKQQEEDFETSSQPIYPFDLLLEHAENSFYDFFKVMENDKADFLDNILSILSMKNIQKSTEAKKVLEQAIEGRRAQGRVLGDFEKLNFSISKYRYLM